MRPESCDTFQVLGSLLISVMSKLILCCAWKLLQLMGSLVVSDVMHIWSSCNARQKVQSPPSFLDGRHSRLPNMLQCAFLHGNRKMMFPAQKGGSGSEAAEKP